VLITYNNAFLLQIHFTRHRSNPFGTVICFILPAAMSRPLTSAADGAKLWPQDGNERIVGKHVILEPLNESHAEPLFPSVSGEAQAYLWDWMPAGPFYDFSNFQSYVKQCSESRDVSFWAVKDRNTDQVVGHSSHLRIDPANASVEIGHIMYSPSLQKTTAATEIWYLLANRAFYYGFRILEWKCNSGNEPSRRAALRFGHTHEGLFRQHMIVKGKNRDTAWFSVIDGEWPRVKGAVEAWMEDSNFDENGKQKLRLEAIRAARES
jgi:RimJ/RimL family protein N-acetyltransferase